MGKGQAVQINFAFLSNPDNKQEAMEIAKQLDRVENDTVENKKKLIERLGTVFEIDGVPAMDISAKLAETIGDFVAPRWIREVCATKKWTRPYKNNNEESADAEESDVTSESNSSDSLNTFLPFDKRLDENGNIDPNQIPYYAYRFPYWKFIRDQKEVLNKIEEELEKDWDIEVTETGKQVKRPRDWSKLFESDKDRDSFFKALYDLYYNVRDTVEKMIDNRQSVLPKQFWIFLAKLSLVTIKHFAAKHYSQIRAIEDITTKKTTQFVKDVNSLSDMLISTMDNSWLWHYLDVKCPECKSFTLKPVLMNDCTWHFVCKNWKAHSKNELVFSEEDSSRLLTVRTNVLTMNSGRASEKLLNERGIGDKN